MNKQEKQENNSGNWEFTPYRKIPEANILRDLVSPNSFNPKNVDLIRNPPKTKETEIMERFPPSEEILKLLHKITKLTSVENRLVAKTVDTYLKKLSSKDRIIITNYFEKRATTIENDSIEIKTLGFNAKPTTNEGRTHFLLYSLNHHIVKGNNDNIANIFLRFLEREPNGKLSFVITPELQEEYKEQIETMNRIVDSMDILELQFNKFHSQMPPLNKKGFTSFDDWQLKVIDNINSKISTVVNAPTSAGKSVLSGYATTKGNVLFIMPTDPLAWQMAAYITNITGNRVPIITKTHQSCPTRNEMIELLNKSTSIVGTADHIIDFLPCIKIQFDWIVFDEIHMIGKPEGSSMEKIAKILSNIPVLALSATIGNTLDLVEWFRKISPEQPIESVVCDKRFFNLQRYYYDNNDLVSLHPLSLIDSGMFADESILLKNFQSTPPNAWDLALKIGMERLGDLEPHVYFSSEKRIELDETAVYFNKLISRMIELYKSEPQYVSDIIASYKNECLNSSSINLVSLAFKLKESNMTPAIFFQQNTTTCLEMVYEFAKMIEEMEDKKYPDLLKERYQLAKKARRMDKKVEYVPKSKEANNTKKELKEMLGKAKLKKDGYGQSSIPKEVHETIVVPDMQEPHSDFVLNTAQYFSASMVEKWALELKKYFPNNGDYYHWIIRLLWRGIGVYTNGLPDPYLRLIQTLACNKQLAIVFSDQSLVFGVSMPFRTSVVIRNEHNDNLDTMLFHQMSGRAGRRGLDKEGNVIFAGFSWDRIKELSVSSVPIVQGVSASDNIIYTIPHANKLSAHYETNQNWENVCKNFLDTTIIEEDSKEFIDAITSNYEGGWAFGLNNDINHLHMNWRFRDSDDAVLVSFLIPYFRRAFEGKDHTKEQNQILLAHFLSRFICTNETTNIKDVLEEPEILSVEPYNTIIDQLQEFDINIPTMVDSRVYRSIQMNQLVECQDEYESHKLRQQLMKFADKLKHIQHYCYHTQIICLSRIMGKLLTRIWWIYHNSSPLMRQIKTYLPIDYDDSEEL